MFFPVGYSKSCSTPKGAQGYNKSCSMPEGSNRGREEKGRKCNQAAPPDQKTKKNIHRDVKTGTKGHQNHPSPQPARTHRVGGFSYRGFRRCPCRGSLASSALVGAHRSKCRGWGRGASSSASGFGNSLTVMLVKMSSPATHDVWVLGFMSTALRTLTLVALNIKRRVLLG